MNILFVNYGDFTTNSLNHIAGFAKELGKLGQACAVAVPANRETIAVISEPAFAAVTYAEALARPGLFPDGRPADLIHAWTPREGVRKFVLAYQRIAHARLVIHLEDNEDFILATWLQHPLEELRRRPEAELAERTVDALSHPRRYRQLLRAADGVTVIVDTLREFVPAGVPCTRLEPGIDFAQEPPVPAAAWRRELGLREGEKVVAFTGSNTFVNEPEMRDLYEAIELLNRRGIPTRLVRTGFNSPTFQASLSAAVKACVLDLGFVEKPRLRRLLALADVLVQPGRAGPFNDFRLPSKLPEFLAAGRPVVLPPANLGRELRDGVDAVILRRGDPEDIADACARIFADPELARRLGENAGSFARRRFDLAANTRGLAEFYRDIAARPARPGSTASLADGRTEISLSVQALAEAAGDPASRALGEDLAALVAGLETQEAATGERARLEHERDEWRLKHDLTRQHNVNVEERLKLTERHGKTLNRELSETRGGLRRLEGQMSLNEKLLAATRAQVIQLTDQLDLVKRGLTEATELLRQRDAKIRIMQESFSWGATAPLRFLRRKLLDPWRRPAAPAPRPAPSSFAAPVAAPTEAAVTPEAPALAIWHSVDNPQSWSLPPRRTLLRGWCFALDGRKLAGVRAVLADRVVPGAHGFKRLDVLASTRGKPQAEYCGWKIELELKASDTFLNIEAADAEGTWHHFFHTALQVGEGLGPLDFTSYEKWLEVYDQPTPEELRAQADRAGIFVRQPVISVIMPTYNTPERWLRRAIESLRAQTYAKWELCIADDGSTEPHVRTILEQAAGGDSRVKVAFRPKNGHISAASNSALALATGDFIALLDHDDELPRHALFEVVAAINARPEVDYFYSDEDKIDENGRRHEPYFKPDWLPDLFLAQNYTSHFSVFRAAAVKKAGGFRLGYEGSQDWDLTLRVTEQLRPEQILHIPKVLYHWRAIPGSTALQLSEKNYPVEAARRALADHFTRTGVKAELVPVPGDHWRVKYPLPANPPLVSIIIPTRNGVALVQRCIESLLEHTAYPRFEILLVDNSSDEPAALAFFATLADGLHPLLTAGHTARVLKYDAPFNYSAINNFAVRQAAGDVIALLNNDLEVITPGWLEEMASQALRPEIGCVGAMLYYPNDTIQHAGTVLGVGGVAGHAFRDFARGTEGRFNRARLVQNYTAVTAACLVIRKAIYQQVGGLDESTLAVAFNDVDFCLKVRAAGYRNLWTPFAEFYHHESASRGADDTPEKENRFRNEVETMLERWGPELQRDPAYNPNLTLELNDFSLASPPQPWSP